jgi:hypothetical protein
MNLEKHMQEIVKEAIAPQKTNSAATMLNRDSINRAYKGLSDLEEVVANNVRHTDNQHREQLFALVSESNKHKAMISGIEQLQGEVDSIIAPRQIGRFQVLNGR